MWLTVLFLLFSISGNAQIFSREVLSSNGESATISGYTLNWTIGEIAIETYSNSVTNLGQGFQQTFYVPMSIEGINQISINSYPNPTFDNLYIEIPENKEDVTVQIINILGQVQLTTAYSGNSPLKIDLSDLESGTYLLNIVTDSKIIKTTKIIKK